MDIACYLVSWSLSPTLDDKNPCDIWIGKKPTLKQHKVFGYDAYVYIPKKNRNKLNTKGEKCSSIGYKDGLKVYNL